MTCSPYLTLIQINISQGVFVLAVTHNGNWIVGSNDNWAVDKGGLSYSLSLVSRMASVFYGIELETIVLIMEEQMSSFPLTKGSQAEDLIRSFVTYMANRVHKDRPIDTFILLIDEAVAMEKHILQGYPGCGDSTSCARSASLDIDITFNGGALSIALEISSLSNGPINGSNRDNCALVLPPKLNKTAVVREIWNADNRSQLSPTHHYRK